ncbi:MAG TPA: 4'-phosphopantetheinyl transferase superfamily protein [Puia sp.]|nr:4'-phosphopantetheinyl transferase superfamily protein [Puia sp.]
MEKIKEIVSGFIKVPPEQIGSGTPINRSAVQSSILLHRMYARLADEGVRIGDYSAVKVFGDLFTAEITPGAGIEVDPGIRETRMTPPTAGTAGIGIDIEDIASLPKTTDFRKEEFYKMNFSPEEIAYCILREDPYASFTGLFAAKEAIVKAGGVPDGRSFDTIRIAHSAEGQPIYPGYALSIAHSAGLAVAVAVRSPDSARENFLAAGPATLPASLPATSRNPVSWLTWLALLLGLAALSLVLIHGA